jgi:multidrug efflux pump subunit AcrA (membrane-fusion protein)
MKKRYWLLLVVMVFALAGCGQGEMLNGGEGEPSPEETRGPVPTPVDTGVTILADGIVQPSVPLLPLSFEIGGTVEEIYVQAGDMVQAGDLIAVLDDTTLAQELPLRQAQAEQALLLAQENIQDAESRLASLDTPATEAAITAARANVTMAAERLEQAERDYQPYRSRPEGNVAKAYYGSLWAEAQQDYEAAVRYLNALLGTPSDQARTELEAELAVAQAQLAQAESDLAQIETALEDTQLTAPWTGTILSIEVAPGALVGGSTPIVSLLDTTQLEFHTINMSERDFGLIVPGQTALVTLKAYPNDPIEAAVVRIGWQAGETVGDAATFPVVLAVGDTDLDIRPGMTGRVEIQVDD